MQVSAFMGVLDKDLTDRTKTAEVNLEELLGSVGAMGEEGRACRGLVETRGEAQRGGWAEGRVGGRAEGRRGMEGCGRLWARFCDTGLDTAWPAVYACV
jgi:hypothetical protein